MDWSEPVWEQLAASTERCRSVLNKIVEHWPFEKFCNGLHTSRSAIYGYTRGRSLVPSVVHDSLRRALTQKVGLLLQHHAGIVASEVGGWKLLAEEKSPDLVISKGGIIWVVEIKSSTNSQCGTSVRPVLRNYEENYGPIWQATYPETPVKIAICHLSGTPKQDDSPVGWNRTLHKANAWAWFSGRNGFHIQYDQFLGQISPQDLLVSGLLENKVDEIHAELVRRGLVDAQDRVDFEGLSVLESGRNPKILQDLQATGLRDAVTRETTGPREENDLDFLMSGYDEE